MTEEEAKTKWCPFVRSVPGSNSVSAAQTTFEDVRLPAHNRIGGTLMIGACAASACMAWRWTEGFGRARVHPSLVDKWAGWTQTDAPLDERGYVEIIKPQQDGFCGLAGRPE